MGAIQIEFLVGLYFIVLDLPGLFLKPLTLQGNIRLIAGIILVVLAFVQFSIIR